MKTFLLVILAAAFSAMTNFAQTTLPVEPGVSQTLARWRAANYSNVRYALKITLEKQAPLMKGELEIKVVLTDEGAKNDLILDWRTTQFENDKDKPYAYVTEVNDKKEPPVVHLNEHIKIPRPFLKTGENLITIKFASPIKTSGAAITRYVDREDGAEYVYSLFVPSDASTAFPVFDQPDLKARFSLTVNLPKRWKVVCNSPMTFWSDQANPKTGEKKTEDKVKENVNDKTIETWEFIETKPISPYVFAFAAGDFTLFADKDDPRSPTTPIPPNEELIYSSAPTIYVRKSQAEKFKAHEKEVFRLNREGVKFLESYFDYKFPFPKYDLVLIPEFPFRGMEHAGATFLREDSIIFPSEPTANDHISRANVLFHEAAHQWFGDCVTMKWFDDLWLKEGFAEFMAYKTLEKVMPEVSAWKAFYERNKPLAYATDSTRGTTPIYQEIPNLSAAKSAYGNIVYRKAPSFLRQAEFYLGEKEFQTAVKAFLKKHEFANAEWTDLVKEFETSSGKDLKDWANVWVKQRGVPIFRTEVVQGGISNVSGQGTAWIVPTINFEQSNALEEKGVWQSRFKVLSRFRAGDFVQEAGSKYRKFAVSAVGKNVRPPDSFGAVFPVPELVFPNYQDYGYGIFLLDKKSRDYILDNIQKEKDPFLRSMMWGALWDSVREAELAPKDYVELAIKNLAVEKDEVTISAILARVSTAMNYYLSDKQRAELAPKLEYLLLSGMQNAPAVGQRITYYRAFLNVASENARDALRFIFKTYYENPSAEAMKILPLKMKDKFDIAARLAVLGDPDARKILDLLTKTETSDDAKRFAYAVGAAFESKEAKEKYFKDFTGNKEIPESWIESSVLSFNAIRHSETTLPFLEKALAELPNLKRNRKIFFVNGWLAAFIGGQKDEKALAVVNKFLADNPNLDKDLRLKILENIDVIERAVKIRGKFGKN